MINVHFDYDLFLLLATFWAWETLRYILEQFLSKFFALTRPAHPLLVATLPLAVLWPSWVEALGVAGATGLLVALVDRVFGSGTSAVVIPQNYQRRNRSGGLPPLP